MKLSIILPVYNVEKYIKKCIESVITQKLDDYELIIVDDGSTDSSGIICDRYAEEFKQIKVIHIENGGVSNARNTALKLANGDYIWFIDSDDYVSKDSLCKIFNEIMCNPDADMFVFNAQLVDENENRIEDIIATGMNELVLSEKLISKMVLANTSLWNRIYKNKIIRDVELEFDTDITIAEDLLFNFQYMLECKKVKFFSECLYFYVQRKNSAMQGSGKNIDVQKAMEKLRTYYVKKDAMTTYKNELDYLAIYHYFIVTNIRLIRADLKLDACKEIKKWFKRNGIIISLRNPFVKKMPLKHIILLVLLKLEQYQLIKLLFKKKDKA